MTKLKNNPDLTRQISLNVARSRFCPIKIMSKRNNISQYDLHMN